MPRRKMVAGNWKMHGSRGQCRALLDGILRGIGSAAGIDVLVCPPFPYLAQAVEALDGKAAVGAQDLCEQEGQGAFTGEVSGAMLVDVGCRYVLVGHSERRHLYGETNERVAEKFAAAQAAGLTPILCVGEQLQSRKADETEQVLAEQLDAVLQRCGVESLERSVLAYEPVWAIGTGETATPELAQAAHAFLRGKIAAENDILAADLRILYGGSVKPDNAADLFACVDVDGGLIGGASLDATDFLAICRAGA